jgi:peroxiredoxin family protein
MNAMLAFEKDLDPQKRYQGDAFSKLLLEKKAPDSVNLLMQGKMLGDMKVYACSMALDMLGWTPDNLVEDMFDSELGLTKFLSDAEEGDLIIV